MKKKVKYKSEHFSNCLYPEIILPVMQQSFGSMDGSYKSKANVAACFTLSNYESILSKAYEEKRDWLRKNYFPRNIVVEKDVSDDVNANKKGLLDMHKIAAVVARCIILHKPIGFELDDADIYVKKHQKCNDVEWLIDNYLVNYKIAVHVALRITLYDLFDRLGTMEENADGKLRDIGYTLQRLAKLQYSEFYDPNDGLLPITHEPFYNSLIINMAINDVNKRDFDYLGFATTCFQLQQYNVLKIEFDQISCESSKNK